MAWDDYFDSAAQGLCPSSDFEWYAVDCKGQVAFLTSAGFGEVPLIVFRDKSAYYEAAESFKSLPIRGGHVLFARGSYDWSSWIKAACQGLFGYDWSASTGQYVPGQPYELMATPEKPLILADLPVHVQEWISPIRFEAEFGVVRELFPEQQFRELNL